MSTAEVLANHNKREAIGHLARHEAFHAGQLELLRRLMGKNFLR